MPRQSKAAGSPGKCASCGKGLPKSMKSKMTKCPHCGKALKTDSTAIEDAALRPVVLAGRRLQEALDAHDRASTNAELVVARAGANVRADQLVAAIRASAEADRPVALAEVEALWEAGFLEKLHPRDRLGKWMEKLEPGTMVRVKPPGPGGPARPVTFKGRSGENVHVEGLGQGFKRGQTYTLPAHRLMEPGGGDHKSHQILGKGVGSLGMFKGSGAVLSRVEAGDRERDWTKGAIRRLKSKEATGFGRAPRQPSAGKPSGDASSALVAMIDDLEKWEADQKPKKPRTNSTWSEGVSRGTARGTRARWAASSPRQRMLREQQVRLLVGAGTVETADEAHILLDRIGT